MVLLFVFSLFAAFFRPFSVCAFVGMGSWQQVLGQAFNALSMGKSANVERLAWASSRSASSGSLSGAEPSGGEISCVAQEASGLGESPCGSKQSGSPASATKRLARQRMQYNLPDQKELGHEACEFRDAYFAEVGRRYGWVSAFLAQRCHIDDMRLPAAKAMCKQLKGAVRTAEGGGGAGDDRPMPGGNEGRAQV